MFWLTNKKDIFQLQTLIWGLVITIIGWLSCGIGKFISSSSSVSGGGGLGGIVSMGRGGLGGASEKKI